MAGMEDVGRASEHLDKQLEQTEDAVKQAREDLRKVAEAVRTIPYDVVGDSVQNFRDLLAKVDALCCDFRTFKDLLMSGMQQLTKGDQLEIGRLNA